MSESKITKSPAYAVTVLPSDYAGRTAYRYTVSCAESGREIAAGWGESMTQAHDMVSRFTAPGRESRAD